MLLSLLLFSAAPALAQSFRGTIHGAVKDASGAVIVGAGVKARNVATGLERSATTAQDGVYVLPEMAAGDYDVTVEAHGLAPVTKRVVVVVGADTAADFILAAVAPLAQKATVTEAMPVIDTTQDVLGGSVQSRLAGELPLNGRDFGKLVALVPGVTVEGSGVAGTEKGFGQFNMNGARDRSNNYMLDGTDNNDPYFNNSALNQVGITGAPATLLPIDAIQEFNLESQYNAEYGRNAGAVVNIVTKSGTNQFHGSLYEYHRNSFLDARNFFNPTSNAQTQFINNQFGGSLGGPIVRDRTFFFLAYEGQRERVGSDFLLFVPTQAQRTQAMQLAEAAEPGINPAPLDAILTKFFPTSSTGALETAVKDKNDLDNFIVRVDHRIGANHTFAARYAFGQSDQTFPLGSLGGFGSGSRIGAFAQTSPTRVQVVSLSLLSTLTPSTLNELRFGYSRFRTSFSALDQGFDPASVGLDMGTGKTGLPEIDFSGIFDNLGATAFSIPRGRVSQSFQLLDNFTLLHGRHTLVFGGEVRRYAINNFNDNLERGLIQFFPTGEFSSDPAVDTLANYYTGGGTFGGSFAEADAGNTLRTTYNNGLAFFAQDEFRLRPSFTLTYGLRWEYFGPLSEKHNLLSNLGNDGLLAVVGTDGLDGVYDRQLRNFAPRIGLAWNPLAKTVVRAGYGIYYDYIPQDLLIANFTNSAGVATNPIGRLPVVPLSFNQGAWNGSAPAPVFTSASPPFSVFVTDRNLHTPYMQSWNLNLEQQLDQNVGLQMGYVGSKGTHLTRLYDANQTNADGVFPNPNFAAEDVFSTGSSSTYHSLQLNAHFQNWHRFTGFAGYVFSKSLDDASDGIDFNFATAAFPQDSTNLRAEKGPSTFDTRHRFTAAMNYQVPAWHLLPPRLGQGWQWNTIVTAQSGRPIGIITSNDTSGRFNFHQRPNVVPGVDPILNGGGNPSGGYINPAAFSQPPDGTFGNLGRNQIYGPKFWNIDFSVTKTTPLRENLNLEFRAEFFNIFNHPNFALPSGVINPGPVPAGVTLTEACPGCVSTQTPDVAQGNPGLGGGGPRVVQLAIRLTF
jgi:Carboxypeptidase regulatory-like domain